MYVEKNFPVPIPPPGSDGRPLFNGKYVYWVSKAIWDSIKQCSKDDRKSIGIRCEDDPGMMWPNKHYVELFGYALDMHKIIHNPTMGFGNYLFALKAADQTGCLTAIKTAFPACWPKAFALIVEWISTRSSVSQYFEHWFFDNFCGFYTPLDPPAITRFYEEIGRNAYALTAYPKTFFKEYKARFLSDKDGVKRAVGCDSTNFNHVTYSNDLLGYGCAKEDKNLPIFGYMNFVDEKTGIMMYGMYHPGALLDKTQISYTLERAIEAGFELLHLMYDRGFLMKENAEYFQEIKRKHGIVFSAIVPSTFKFVKQYIPDYKDCLYNSEMFYIPCENVYGLKLEEHPFFVDPNDPDKYGDENKLFDLYLFYDDLRASQERNSISERVNATMRMVESAKRYSEALVNSASPLVIVTPCEPDPKTGKDFVYERNINHIQEMKDMAGYFVTMSNSGETPEGEIIVVRRRDMSEKSYIRRKTFDDMKTPGTANQHSFRGKCLIADMAQNVAESVRYVATPYLQAKSSRTVETLMCELAKVKLYINDDGIGSPLYALTRQQKELFACLDLTPEAVEAYMRSIHWGETPGMIYSTTEVKTATAKLKQLKAETDKASKNTVTALNKAVKAAEREANKARSGAISAASKAVKKAERIGQTTINAAERKISRSGTAPKNLEADLITTKANIAADFKTAKELIAASLATSRQAIVAGFDSTVATVSENLKEIAATLNFVIFCNEEYN